MKRRHGLRQSLTAAVAGCALRYLGRKRPSRGEIEEAVAQDWKVGMQRLGLHRHVAWHDRFRSEWIKLRRLW